MERAGSAIDIHSNIERLSLDLSTASNVPLIKSSKNLYLLPSVTLVAVNQETIVV